MVRREKVVVEINNVNTASSTENISNFKNIPLFLRTF